ncbi:Ankyrin [Mycena venus]|uniref:Ankyrin n=1 Tax=Mycena venus TaxID=2733690 RepID=A0A8H6X5L9_9AGAR|nr:Ankyrin [Mycena venus]
MAEVLGTIGNIIQLVDIALKTRDFIQEFRHAPQEQQKLLSEMNDLRLLLGELQTRIAANPSSSTLGQMANPLATFNSTMILFTEKLRTGDGSLSKLSSQLKWSLWNKKEAIEYLGKFEQFKSLLSSWLLLDMWDMGQQHGRDNSSVLQSMKKVSVVQQELLSTVNNATLEYRQQIDSAQRTGIIEWFSPINFFLQQADVFRALQEGTGGWFLAEPRFKAWVSGTGGTLWCYGIPGAGKTVMAAKVVDYLSAQTQNGDIGVACIYLNHKETEIQTPSNLLAGLWRQLVVGGDIGFAVQNLHQRHFERRTRPSLTEVHHVLQSVIGRFSTVYIVVDAVDEYPEDPRRVLLDNLAAMGPTVNLMITSRSHIVPHVSLRQLQSLEIRANIEDIRRYVNEHIELSSRLSKHVRSRPELHEEILSKVSFSVDGMFLLAKLHLDALSTKSTIKAVREALSNLPKDLKDTYDNAMERIETQNEEDRRVAHSALIWVINARRPLTALELRVALAIEPSTRYLDGDNILDIEMILSVCAGLVIADEQLTVVRLVHYTAHEYFEGIKSRIFPHAQTVIAGSLLTYVAFDDVAQSSRNHLEINPPPLLDYAQYCLVHAAGEPERQLRNMIMEFLGRVKELKSPSWNSPPWDLLYWPEHCSPLWVAAAADLLVTAQWLLRCMPTSHETKTAALQIASFHGHLHMAALLIEHGADVNAPAGRYRLRMEPTFLGEETTQKVLENGPDVHEGGTDYGAALQAASLGGNPAMVQMLLENGADVNARWGDCGNALQAASTTGSEIIVSLLLDNGADVNALGGEYGSALHAASFTGNENVLQLLLERGAQINTPIGQYGSALQAASSAGWEAIVRLLLVNGADVNAHGGPHCSALYEASYNEHDSIVQLLLAYGADPNLQGGLLGNALQAASSEGHENIVRLLVENGADVKVQGGVYGSALDAALCQGHDNVAQFLVERSANTGAQCALESALSREDDTTVRMLIEKIGNIYSALEVALSEGRAELAQLLIQKIETGSICDF